MTFIQKPREQKCPSPVKETSWENYCSQGNCRNFTWRKSSEGNGDLRQVILRNGVLSSMILTETIMPDGSIHP